LGEVLRILVKEMKGLRENNKKTGEVKTWKKGKENEE